MLRQFSILHFALTPLRGLFLLLARHSMQASSALASCVGSAFCILHFAFCILHFAFCILHFPPFSAFRLINVQRYKKVLLFTLCFGLFIIFAENILIKTLFSMKKTLLIIGTVLMALSAQAKDYIEFLPCQNKNARFCAFNWSLFAIFERFYLRRK